VIGCQPRCDFFSWFHFVQCSFNSRRDRANKFDLDQSTSIHEVVKSAVRKSDHKFFLIPDGPQDKHGRRGGRDQHFVKYLAGRIQAIEEEGFVKRMKALQAQFAEPDGLEKVLQKYAPELAWLDKGNFEDPLATKVYEDWSASEESIYDDWYEESEGEDMEEW
jgi:hypothetical protein